MSTKAVWCCFTLGTPLVTPPGYNNVLSSSPRCYCRKVRLYLHQSKNVRRRFTAILYDVISFDSAFFILVMYYLHQPDQLPVELDTCNL